MHASNVPYQHLAVNAPAILHYGVHGQSRGPIMCRNESLLRARWAGRLEERERIARKLHDTLLQGTQGLILQMQSVAGRLPPQHPTRRQIESALDQAGDLLGEARAKVRDLRSSVDYSDIGSSIARSGQLLSGRTAIAFQFEMHGALRVVRARVAAEIYAIAREALTNAFAHSRANNVCATLSFGSVSLVVRIIDDGQGFDPSQDNQQSDRGHFGILGMRERAHELGGQLLIASRIGLGTEVEFAVNASAAYLHRPVLGASHVGNPSVMRQRVGNSGCADSVSQFTGNLCVSGPSNEKARGSHTETA
jgi:signal transduction histidine kinase